MKMSKIAALLSVTFAAGFSQSASALQVVDLAGWQYETYGNVNSYCLQCMAQIFAVLNGTSPNNASNPYYIQSGPGQLSGDVLIYTGVNQKEGYNYNVSGIENPYLVPNGSTDLFASTQPSFVDSPTFSGGIANTRTDTWDMSLAALYTFLGNGAYNPLFFFNNNQEGSGSNEDLAIWAKLWVTDPTNSLVGQYMYLTNMGLMYGYAPNNNPLTYNPGNIAPTVGTSASTDYVKSGGPVCLGAAPTFTQLECSDSNVVYTLDNNLGANQAAYAADVPLFDQMLQGLFAGLSDPNDPSSLANYTMHVFLNLGCPAALQTTVNNKTVCSEDGWGLNNGYEQLFLGASTIGRPPELPEPATLALMGLGLIGLGFARRHHQS